MSIATSFSKVITPALRVPDMRGTAVKSSVNDNTTRSLYERLYRSTSSRSRQSPTSPVAARKPTPFAFASSRKKPSATTSVVAAKQKQAQTSSTTSPSAAVTAAPRKTAIIARARADFSDASLRQSRIPAPTNKGIKEAEVRCLSKSWFRAVMSIIQSQIETPALEITDEASEVESEPDCGILEWMDDIPDEDEQDMCLFAHEDDDSGVLFCEESFDEFVSLETQTDPVTMKARNDIAMKRLAIDGAPGAMRDGLALHPLYTGENIGIPRVRPRMVVEVESKEAPEEGPVVARDEEEDATTAAAAAVTIDEWEPVPLSPMVTIRKPKVFAPLPSTVAIRMRPLSPAVTLRKKKPEPVAFSPLITIRKKKPFKYFPSLTSWETKLALKALSEVTEKKAAVKLEALPQAVTNPVESAPAPAFKGIPQAVTNPEDVVAPIPTVEKALSPAVSIPQEPALKATSPAVTNPEVAAPVPTVKLEGRGVTATAVKSATKEGEVRKLDATSKLSTGRKTNNGPKALKPAVPKTSSRKPLANTAIPRSENATKPQPSKTKTVRAPTLKGKQSKTVKATVTCAAPASVVVEGTLKSALRKPGSKTTKKQIEFLEGPLKPGFYCPDDAVSQSTVVDANTPEEEFDWEPITTHQHSSPSRQSFGLSQLFKRNDANKFTMRTRFLRRFVSVRAYEARRRQDKLSLGETPGLGQLEYGNADCKIALNASKMIMQHDIGTVQELSAVGKAGRSLGARRHPMEDPVVVFGSFYEPYEPRPIPDKAVKAYKRPVRWPAARNWDRFIERNFWRLAKADPEN
ncbi:hypothetical protein GMOD_00002673 [Pyrenophora seminiperda CCB06]|uniref:Uncharacterized protein n=1 Tax=Pyrenophora seminiperda CCB06 TaxID=1302712 RepID=A0A3M7M2W4_9PLEO|nr:hypothetical protein GMOD_00002673 [Pyrenophora seminiperda CCB06]